MRKLIVSMNLTLNGCLAGAHGELDWHIACWTKEMGDALCRQMATTDTVLLGRVTYTAMAAHYSSIVNGSTCRAEDFAFANMMNSNKKIVVSKTMTKPCWNNTVLLKGNLQRAITKLKKQQGTDIVVFGSSQLVSSLIAIGQVDEYRLWIHPVVINNGISFFSGLKGMHRLKLIQTETFASGVVLFQYKNLHLT